MVEKSRRSKLLLKLGKLAVKEARRLGLDDTVIDDALEDYWESFSITVAAKILEYVEN